ncbi:hypothetical protein BP6252_13496 [Coleophoma cylindrospora]|uniref:RanBD1 domain-containing protein n=1 Tax=Coleophoma cylindrospora TaxID=1849047 RepID=A0A3D8Q8C1_9HELO|nr:hypothetical protein BP6252_13496 [Coleophoma cylindrospora]
MTSTVSADAVPDTTTQDANTLTEVSDIMGSNHHKEGSASSAGALPEISAQEKEDPATMAASEELRHTSISEGTKRAPQNDVAGSEAGNADGDKHMEGTQKETTPPIRFVQPTEAQDNEMRERLSSPKKKRGRDQDDDEEYSDDSKIDDIASADATTNGGRTTRLEPEKKRHRDTSNIANAETDSSKIGTAREKVTEEGIKATSSTPIFGSGSGDKPQTSASAFASSGFGALASSTTSPFGVIGASKPSVFGGGGASASASPFGALAGSSSTTSPFGASKPSESSVFGANKTATASGFGASTSSFGGAAGQKSVFGSGLSNGFGAGAPKLSSFAAPGQNSVAITSAKPAKAFGAPDSDEDENSDGEDDSDGEGAEEEEGEKLNAEDKKKFKTKVPIDDGEAGEATLLQFRAKLYTLESKEVGWKERGVGTLKVNVNKSCVDTSENGQPDPMTLDFSSMDSEDNKDSNIPAARLVMRQENTHRVILNTIIVQAMEFKEKPSSASAVQILFTALEGSEHELKPVNMLLKLSEANANLFTKEIEHIQHELKDLP